MTPLANKDFKSHFNHTRCVPKVLQRFYYTKRGISATLVEAIFKLMKVQR